MSFKAVIWARGTYCRTPAQRHVLLVLASCAHPVSGVCWPTQKQLADWCGLSPKTVNTAISYLIDSGKVERAAPPINIRGNAYRVKVSRRFRSDWDESDVYDDGGDPDAL